MFIGETVTVVDAVLATAKELGRSPAQVATAWVLERSRRLTTSSIPIIGPRDLAQLDDYLGALDLELTPEQYDVPTDVSAVPLGVPHDANAAALNGLRSGAAALFESPAVPVA